MNKSIALLMLLAFSSSAFATHAYRSETCISQSTNQAYKLVYKGNYPFGGAFGLSKLGSEEEVELFQKEETADPSVNEFDVVRGKTLSSKVTKDRCTKGDPIRFRNEISKTQTVVNVSNLSAEAEAILDLKSGTYVIFNCNVEYNFPEQCKK